MTTVYYCIALYSIQCSQTVRAVVMTDKTQSWQLMVRLLPFTSMASKSKTASWIQVSWLACTGKKVASTSEVLSRIGQASTAFGSLKWSQRKKSKITVKKKIAFFRRSSYQYFLWILNVDTDKNRPKQTQIASNAVTAANTMCLFMWPASKSHHQTEIGKSNSRSSKTKVQATAIWPHVLNEQMTPTLPTNC